jgi:hypothetical protein
MLSILMTPIAFAQGTYTPFGVPSSLGINLDDVKDFRDLLKDYYEYKGSILGAIDELRDDNSDLDAIFSDNGITRDVTEDVISTLLETADPESVSDLDEVVTALYDLKNNYQDLIDNLENNFAPTYDFNEDGTSKFATYLYYLGREMQNKKIMTFDENGDELYFSFADEFSNTTTITTEIDGIEEDHDLDDYIGLAVSDRNDKSIDDLDQELEDSLNDMLDDYLDSSESNYDSREIADIVEAFDLLNEIDTTPVDPPDDDDDNNAGGGGGGGFTPPTAQNGPRAVNDNIITGENMPVDVTIDELLENDIDADSFVGLGRTNNGTAELNGDIITFTPRNNFTGRGIFRYIIADDEGREDTGLVLVEISDEIVVIEDGITPLGNGGPNQLSVIDHPDIPGAIVPFKGSYIEGYPDGTFNPDGLITRGEIIAILTRVLEVDTDEPGKALFSDVKPDDWYYEAVQAFAKKDLISGYPDGTFKPNKTITHGEVATILSNYWRKNNVLVSLSSSGYTDIEGHWAKYHIRRMFNAGVSVRFGDGSFRPNQETTRSEAAIIINQFIGRPTTMELTNKFKDIDDTIWGAGAIEAASEPIE